MSSQLNSINKVKGLIQYFTHEYKQKNLYEKLIENKLIMLFFQHNQLVNEIKSKVVLDNIPYSVYQNTDPTFTPNIQTETLINLFTGKDKSTLYIKNSILKQIELFTLMSSAKEPWYVISDGLVDSILNTTYDNYNVNAIKLTVNLIYQLIEKNLINIENYQFEELKIIKSEKGNISIHIYQKNKYLPENNYTLKVLNSNGNMSLEFNYLGEIYNFSISPQPNENTIILPIDVVNTLNDLLIQYVSHNKITHDSVNENIIACVNEINTIVLNVIEQLTVKEPNINEYQIESRFNDIVRYVNAKNKFFTSIDYDVAYIGTNVETYYENINKELRVEKTEFKFNGINDVQYIENLKKCSINLQLHHLLILESIKEDLTRFFKLN